MATLTIHMNDSLVRYVEEAARREHKSVSTWVEERVRPETDRFALIAAMEARAAANGYPPGWLTLFGSLAGDDALAAPERRPTRAVDPLNGD